MREPTAVDVFSSRGLLFDMWECQENSFDFSWSSGYRGRG